MKNFFKLFSSLKFKISVKHQVLVTKKARSLPATTTYQERQKKAFEIGSKQCRLAGHFAGHSESVCQTYRAQSKLLSTRRLHL